MAGFTGESDSEYEYDLTVSDEELLCATVDRLSSPVPPQSRGPSQNALPSSPFSSSLDPDATLAIDETLAAITDDDLTFDISELDADPSPSHGRDAEYVHGPRSRKLAPSVSGSDDELASFVSKTKPRSMPTLLPGPDVRYPDLSRALSDAQKASKSSARAREQAGDSSADSRPPLLRFRTFPMKPLSVSDLTAGAWCELQYFYTLTRLPGGRKTRTTAMKRGSDVHERLEREVFTPVQIQVTKKEDAFGLKIWNIIQGLRMLRDQGFTRELEVWGMVDSNVVNGVIDGLSYENPDPELQEDVLSSRGSSQTVPADSQSAVESSLPSTQGDFEVFITDVKTRTSDTPPPQAQVRGAIIQLFLYHRFLSEMASDKLDYTRVFERYGLNLEEPFSDTFMAQIGALHEEVFPNADGGGDVADTDAQSASSEDNSDAGSGADYRSAVSSPSRLSLASTTSSSSASSPALKYRTLRALLPLLRFELHLTFPRGASDLGKIVAVEYRYRGRDRDTTTTTTTNDDVDDGVAAAPPPDDEADPDDEDQQQQQQRRRHHHHRPRPPPPAPAPAPARESGSVICVNTFFVEPETLDLFLGETMRWWRGEREPRGVALEEAFKCRSCEFVGECEWRRGLDQEALRKARLRNKERERVVPAVEEAPGGSAGGSSGRRARKKRVSGVVV